MKRFAIITVMLLCQLVYGFGGMFPGHSIYVRDPYTADEIDALLALYLKLDTSNDPLQGDLDFDTFDIFASDALKFLVSGDPDDYLSFSTVGNVPTTTIVGGNLWFITSESGTPILSLFEDESNRMYIGWDGTDTGFLGSTHNIHIQSIANNGDINLSPHGTGDIILSNLTDNGFVKTNSDDGTLSVDTNTYYSQEQLGSNDSALGASLIGIEDSMSLYIATDVEAALEEVKDLVTVVVYSAGSIVTLPGGLTVGSVSDIQTINEGNVYTITETNGAPNPNFTTVITFTDIGTGHEANKIQLHYSYNGTIGHNVTLEIENSPYDDSVWDLVDTLTQTAGTLTFVNVDIPGTITDYDNSGTTKIRIIHNSNGVNTHDFVIDYAVILDDPAGMGGITDHGQLSGQADDDHTQYLLENATRELSADWDVGDFSLTMKDLTIDGAGTIRRTNDSLAITATVNNLFLVATNDIIFNSGGNMDYVVAGDINIDADVDLDINGTNFIGISSDVEMTLFAPDIAIIGDVVLTGAFTEGTTTISGGDYNSAGEIVLSAGGIKFDGTGISQGLSFYDGSVIKAEVLYRGDVEEASRFFGLTNWGAANGMRFFNFTGGLEFRQRANSAAKPILFYTNNAAGTRKPRMSIGNFTDTIDIIMGLDASFPVRVGINKTPTVPFDVNGASSFGDDTNEFQISGTGDVSFAGSAGFYPRIVRQDEPPANGSGSTQIDDEEQLIWIDTNDSNKVYLMFNDNDNTQIVKIQLQ